MQREKYEWANIWWEDADDNAISRILLIGDSICVGYRGKVQELLKGRYAVDLLATSKSLDDPSYIKELDYMLSQYTYKAIHFNNGIHGLHMDIDTYKTSYEYILNYILAKFPNIVLATSTPATDENDHTKYAKNNSIICERNRVVKELANKNNLPINDLYSAMDGKYEYKRDSYHYNEDGTKEQSQIVCKSLLEVL